MLKTVFVLYHLLGLCELLWANNVVSAITPKDCSLDCIQQGGSGCEYCRITREHVKEAVGFTSMKEFGSCIPWPCFDLLGKQDPKICQHYVQAPNDVMVEFVQESDPKSDTIVVSWKPSYYDWYPTNIGIKQEGPTVTLTFNLAPPNLDIRSYFSLCYANGMTTYTDIKPNFTQNKTHHSFQMNDLQGDTNYTCQIAANEVDAVRKTFNVYVMPVQKEDAMSRSVAPSLVLILPLCLTAVVIILVLLAALTKKRPQLHISKLSIEPVLTSYEEQLYKASRTMEEVAFLPRDRPLTPPRLLICYSCHDCPAHIRSVMLLGAFIQQHMATQVILDMWETLSMAVEGNMAWYCRHIQESDFILVICSKGLSYKSEPPEPDDSNIEEELDFESNAFSSDTAVQLIREEVGRAKAKGRDLSKYMAAIFEYSEEEDIPNEMRLVSQYRLTTDLEVLFSHLHGVALHRPGGYLKINDFTEEGFSKLPAGAALQQAIYEAKIAMRAKDQRTMEKEDL
ncbi:interleukin-17 receptor D isoform X3 [Antennarius striatus]|uniref:interleukin-17 receptor D isoform X3 n=1 Tax=Antennarius striatus TaxID=241820 RepID=UPI0035AEEA8B